MYICKAINEHGLSLQQCVGQCYDSAESCSEVPARILEKAPTAVYIQCYAHHLNLVKCMVSNTYITWWLRIFSPCSSEKSEVKASKATSLAEETLRYLLGMQTSCNTFGQGNLRMSPVTTVEAIAEGNNWNRTVEERRPV